MDYYYEDDQRNAAPRRVIVAAPARPAGGATSSAPPPYYPPPAYYPGNALAPMPATGCAPSPLINPQTGALKLGLIADVLAQGLAAMQSLPAAPPVVQNDSQNIANIIEYQHALASAAKADERIRLLGSLARLFLQT